MADLVIEMRVKGSDWEMVGTYSADSPKEVAELRAILEGREPLEALDDLPDGIIRDALDIVRELGHEARIRFTD